MRPAVAPFRVDPSLADTAAIALQVAALAVSAAGGACFGALRARNRSVAAEAVLSLRRSLLQIPEIAQRLFSATNLRSIPDAALDLAEEMLAPTYCAFFSLRRGGYVATAVRGEVAIKVGHRVELGEGVVGLAAHRQLALTPESLAREQRSAREAGRAALSVTRGFSVCSPIVAGEQTIGVILIGPVLREVAAVAELARTISLMAAAAETNVRLIEREQHLAKTDGLTGLLNKRAILEHLRERLTPGRAGVVSVFLFDVDHFKKYNDTNGHLAGDDLLRGLGALIREHSRDGEGLGRYGGEEFLLVMDGVPKARALAAADRLRELVASAPLPLRESQPGGQLTISGGVASWPSDGEDLNAVLKAADDALYASKHAGRNRVTAHHLPGLALEDGELDDGSLGEEKPQ
jgi:two-component system cell cycle response regulator